MGRGQHNLNSYLNILESHLHDNSFKLPAPLSTVSLDVDPSRISLPTTVGSANPQLWLPSQVAALLADPVQLQLPRSQWPEPLPHGCLRVKESVELQLYERLLETGVCGLVEDAAIPRDA